MDEEHRKAVALLLAQQHMIADLEAQLEEEREYINQLQYCLDGNDLWLHQCDECQEYFQEHYTDEDRSEGFSVDCSGCDDVHSFCHECNLKMDITTRLFCWYSMVCHRHFDKCKPHCQGLHFNKND